MWWKFNNLRNFIILGVYRAVVNLVKSRLEKAKSVGKKSKKKEGSLGNAFAENFVEDLKNGK